MSSLFLVQCQDYFSKIKLYFYMFQFFLNISFILALENIINVYFIEFNSVPPIKLNLNVARR